MLAFDLLLFVAGIPLLLASGYLLLGTVLSARARPAAPSGTWHRLRFVVPAHNEASGITATVVSLLAVDYPKESFDVVVVADNCSDDTAERARNAGATVLERQDAELKGKGYALQHAFDALPAGVDGVVVVDADTLISPNLLRAFSARLSLGAHAIQADYAVRNPNASWRTRLIAIAFGSFHIVRSRARERFGVSCGLRGNGMCFSTALLAAVPHNAFSLVEDVEYGIRIGEAGYRVYYADEAHVYGEMVSSAAASASQRNRWEEGRRALVRQNAVRLLRQALRQRSLLLLDLAIDLLIPPLSRLAIGAAVGLIFAVIFALRSSTASFAFCVAALVLYVLRGWMVSGTGLRGLTDLGLAPIYLIWKVGLRLRRPAKPSAAWVRTKREEPVASRTK